MEPSSRDVRTQSGIARGPELRRAIWAGEQPCRSPLGDSERAAVMSGAGLDAVTWGLAEAKQQRTE